MARKVIIIKGRHKGATITRAMARKLVRNAKKRIAEKKAREAGLRK